MKKSFFALTLVALSSSYAQKIPNMLCHQQIVVYVNPKTFETRKTETNDIKRIDLYRIENDELYITSPTRAEYRYNKLNEIENLRFYGGHKTILFDKEYKSAISTHTYDDEIRVMKFKCSPKAKEK
jgi:hypothetical protein